MSNCIDFVNGSDKVVFYRDDIDAPALKALVDSATQADQDCTDKADLASRDRYFAWWFLKGNSVIDDRGAVIYFGRGNSGHTNRDFDGLLEMLFRFTKRSKYHTFFITDEGDGHRKVYREQIEFHPTTPRFNGKTRQEKDAAIKAHVDRMLKGVDFSKITIKPVPKLCVGCGDNHAPGNCP